jgi:hypothetical protein
LFKVIDSLEMLEDNYSKKFLLKIIPLCGRAVLSFATRSLVKRQKFKERNWITNFIKENFKVIDEFEFGGEKYVVFEKRNVNK